MLPRAPQCCLLLAHLLLCHACHLIYPFGIYEPPVADGASGERAPVADGSRDGALVDGVVDGPEDRGVDLAGKPDAQPDAWTDASATGVGCIAGATMLTPFGWSSMVICRLGSAQVTACSAGSLCKPPWTHCTAKQYRARGGDNQGTALATAEPWIRSCVRKAGIYQQPSDQTCTSTCAKGSAVTNQPSAWGCSSPFSYGGTTWPNLGVVAKVGCYKLGESMQKGLNAHWYPKAEHLTSDAAVCCAP